MRQLKTLTESESIGLDLSDLVYRCNIFVLENDTFGNKTASFEAINCLERFLNPYLDKAYAADIENLSNIKKPEGRTPNEKKVLHDRYLQAFMYGKHEALQRLAYRRGFLPATKNQALKDGNNV